MSTLIVQSLNALLNTAFLFLIAGGLSLVYGVMRIVNLAHGNLYMLGAFAMVGMVGVAGGTVPPAALIALLPFAALVVALVGAAVEPTLLRPLYARAEEYQLLMTFGLLLILEDVTKFVWGPTPLSASTLWGAFGTSTIFGSDYPNYNLVVIVIGLATAVLLGYGGGARHQCAQCVRAGLRPRVHDGGAGRRGDRPDPGRGARHGRRRAGALVCGRRHRGPGQP